jgi:hypothetical protein
VVSLGRRGGYVVAGVAVLAVALVLYVPTLMPGLGTWDTAEFQAIGPTLGVAHPTGYPTYTLLAWLASVLLQPVGEEAYRANLLSALLLAGAAALLAVRAVGATARWPLGVLAGLTFVLAPVAWRVATRADAHALHVFLAAVLLLLLWLWQTRREADPHHAGRWLIAAAVVYGLALGNHALTLLLAPGIAVFVLLVAPRILWRERRLVLTSLVALVLTTVLVYLYLPLRSAMEPPLDYADPQTWESFWYVVLGEQFQGSFRGLPPLADLVSGVWDELVRNLGLLAALALAGAVLGLVRHPRLLALTGLWFVASWLFAIGYPNANIERYYLVPLLVAALWVALAADAVVDVLRDALAATGRALAYRASLAALAVVLLLVTVAPVPARYDRADASDETYGQDWLDATLAALEPEAAVISWWSYSTPLWYGRWVEGRRPDIVIVDDRDVIDDGFGSAEAAVEHFLSQRPTYIVRLDRDLPEFEARFELEQIETIRGPGKLFRVHGVRQPDESAAG